MVYFLKHLQTGMSTAVPRRSVITILKILLVVMAMFSVRYSSAFNAHDFFNNMSARCRERSSCSGNSSTDFSRLRSCQCDAQCATYGDCCQDSPHFKPSSLQECVTAGDWNTPPKYKNNYYMIKSCPSTWNDEDTRSKCENYNGTIRSEPIVGHPITSSATNITYVNYHCAKCNGDFDIRTIIRWKLAVKCSEPFSLPLPDINTIIKEADYGNNSMLRPRFNASHRNCELYVWRPIKLLRACHLNTVVTCPHSLSNETETEQCGTYTSFVFKQKLTPYRNPHCATCNNVTIRQMKCEKTDMEVETGFPEMFDFSDKSSDEVGLMVLCPNDNEAYDMTAKECRPFSVEMTEENWANKSDNCSGSILSSDFNKCLIFIFRREEYKLIDECTVKVFPHNKVYGEGNFRITKDDSLELCTEYLITRPKFEGFIKYLTYLGLGVSIVFLLLHLAIFATNPALRNLNDKSLASFCTVLLLGYGASITGHLLNVGSMACKVTAVVTYFSFMSAFAWLLLIAFDVCYVLRLSITRLRTVSGHSRRYAFLIYSTLGFLVFPLFFVSTALFMEYHQDGPTFKPRFGDYYCWFGSRNALFVFFGIPVSVVMAINFFLFLWSAYMICTSTMSPLNKSSNNSTCALYARLSLLMGLTWIMGFIADCSDSKAVWCIYVALNSFQGIFIFLAFTLTKKVREGYNRQVSEEASKSASCWSRTRSKSSSSYISDARLLSDTKR